MVGRVDLADGARLAQPLLRAHERARPFGRGVVLPHDRAEPLDQPLLHLDRARRGAVQDEDRATRCRSARFTSSGSESSRWNIVGTMCVCVMPCCSMSRERLAPPTSRPSSRSARRAPRAPTTRTRAARRGTAGRCSRCTCRSASYCVSSADVEIAARIGPARARPSAGRSCPTCRASCRRRADRRSSPPSSRASASSQARSRRSRRRPRCALAGAARARRRRPRRRRSARRRRTRSRRSRRRCSRPRRR